MRTLIECLKLLELENGKKFAYILRTEKDNSRFISLLQQAESLITQAIEDITYSPDPEVNKDVSLSLTNCINTVSKIGYDVANDDLGLIRLVEAKTLYNYYELQYFRSRKDNGTISIKTPLCMWEYNTEDEFLLDLVKRGELDGDMNDYISNIRVVKTGFVS